MSRDGAGELNRSSPTKGHSVLVPTRTNSGQPTAQELCLHAPPRFSTAFRYFPASQFRSEASSPGVIYYDPSAMRSPIDIRGVFGFRVRAIQPARSVISSHLSGRFSQANETANHALQRTAPRVTLAAAHHPAACAHPAPATFPQPARRAPQSLSLGSLAVLARLSSE